MSRVDRHANEASTLHVSVHCAVSSSGGLIADEVVGERLTG